MNTGRMARTRIAILEPVREADGQGGDIARWKVYKAVWADYRPLKGTEKFTQDQIENPSDVTVQIRWQSEFKNKNLEACRVIFEGQQFKIINVSNLMNDNKVAELSIQKIRTDEGDTHAP